MLSDKLRMLTNITAAEFGKDYTFNSLNITGTSSGKKKSTFMLNGIVC